MSEPQGFSTPSQHIFRLWGGKTMSPHYKCAARAVGTAAEGAGRGGEA